jgi:hypothetical protein
MNSKALVLSALGCSVLAFLSGCSSGGKSAGGLSSARTLAEQLEAAEMGAKSEVSIQTLDDDLTRARTAVAEHLDENPEDFDALLLSARLGRLQELTDPMAVGSTPESVAAADERISAIDASLARAQTLRPDSAEPHYWKGRVYGTRRPTMVDGAMTFAPVNIATALQEAQAACDMDPSNVGYRETLASLLVATGSFDQALEVMRQIPGEPHPCTWLLSDLNSFALPSGAVYLGDESQSFATQQLQRGRIENHPQFRVRIYAVGMSADEVESFYRTRHRGFSLFNQSEGLFTQFFSQERSTDDSFKPAVHQWQVPTTPTNVPGLLMSVIEVENPPTEKWERLSASDNSDWTMSAPGEVMCYIYIQNTRPVE